MCRRAAQLRLSNCSASLPLGRHRTGNVEALQPPRVSPARRDRADSGQLGPLHISSPRTVMSAIASTSTSHSNFVSLFNAALETYKHKTKKDLATHPLLLSLQSCDSPDAILSVLREQIPTSSQSQNGDDGLTKWVAPTVNVLYAFSATVGGGVGLVSIMLPCEEFLL
jgi:hypothetical protein